MDKKEVREVKDVLTIMVVSFSALAVDYIEKQIDVATMKRLSQSLTRIKEMHYASDHKKE